MKSVMTGLTPTSAFLPIKSQNCVAGCEQLDKDRQQPYFKPVQHPAEPYPVNFASTIPSLTNSSVPRYGTYIPNRIFVGGIDFKTKEEDLQKFFCAFGRVKHTNIKRDRAEISKGFGFVTFESAEEANKVREQEDNLYMNGKKLNIGPAIRKQQPGFPKDIHIPGPPGSWVIHPAGYASFTNPNGITYFLDYNPPMMTSIQQPQNFPHGHMMAYSGEAYPTVPAHYTSYTYPTPAYSGAAYNTLHLPYHAPISGACGQLIAPAPAHTGVEALNVLPMTSAIPAPSYLMPRSMATNAQTLSAVSTRPPDAVSAPEKAGYFPQNEPIRMLVPTSSSYIHPSVQPPFLHSQPTAVYAQPVPIKCAHAQYIGIPDGNACATDHCDVMPDADVQTAMTQAMVTAENEVLPPPLATGQ